MIDRRQAPNPDEFTRESGINEREDVLRRMANGTAAARLAAATAGWRHGSTLVRNWYCFDGNYCERRQLVAPARRSRGD